MKIMRATTTVPHAIQIRGATFMSIAASCRVAFRWLAVIACGLLVAGASATAEPIKFCSSGTITMGPFAVHIDTLRKAHRYDPEEIDKLIADRRAGGPAFFSSQVVIEEVQSGSGHYDLNLFHGFLDPHVKYRTGKPSACGIDDYPLIYFVGFKFRGINKGSILVSRKKGAVNVVSLKTIDPDLDKHTRVIDSQSGAALCDDIAAGCIKQIFYGRW